MTSDIEKRRPDIADQTGPRAKNKKRTDNPIHPGIQALLRPGRKQKQSACFSENALSLHSLRCVISFSIRSDSRVGDMTGVPMADAGLTMPVLAFLTDDDVFPFDDLILLLGKSGWLALQDRHVGIEIVDADGRRWVISGLCPGVPEKRRWWDFRRPVDPGEEIELQPLDPQGFDVTRERVEAQASALFEEGDEALEQIRSSSTMAELSTACFQITARAQGRRIVAGNRDVPIRTEAEVARRALMLFSMVRLSHDVDRFDIMEWLDKHGLIQSLSPQEAELLAARQRTAEQNAEAGGNIEGLVALLWALGFVDMPSGDDLADLSAFIEIVPPAGDLSFDAFLAAAKLRPSREIAAMSEDYHGRLRQARIAYSESSSSDTAAILGMAHRREWALQWILNPDRLSWA